MSTILSAERQPDDHRNKAKRWGRPFERGRSPNPGGLIQNGKRYQELYSRLLAELGGSLTAIEDTLLDKAVLLLLRRPKHDRDAVKLTSEARRILDRLRAGCAAKSNPSMTLAEYAASKYAKADVP